MYDELSFKLKFNSGGKNGSAVAKLETGKVVIEKAINEKREDISIEHSERTGSLTIRSLRRLYPSR